MDAQYLFIGRGRLSSHFQNYFAQLHIPVQVWWRELGESELERRISRATHVLCLISDSAIEPFLGEHQSLLKDKVVIHASGSVTTEWAVGAHPLMTFGAGNFYPLATYRSIPFVVEEGGRRWPELFPSLPNPHFLIAKDQKLLYHALCVMAGNFTTLLWQKAFRDFKERLDLPVEILFPYLQQITTNLMESPESALTGPLARGDRVLVERHLEEFEHDPFAEVYRAFAATRGLA